MRASCRGACARNRIHWDARAVEYVGPGERAWARQEPTWGIWRVPDSACMFKEKALGPDHPDLAAALNNLGMFYCARGLYAKAESLYNRSLPILVKALGPDHPDLATSLNNLALLYHVQGLHEQAEPLYNRSLAIMEKALGPEHPNVIRSLENMAALYRATNREAEVDKVEKRAERIRERHARGSGADI